MVQQGKLKTLLCHNKVCSVSEIMLPEFEDWISLWRILNSKTGQSAGVSGFVIDAVNLKGEDIELLLELDQVFASVENEKREARAAKK
jgi:hypothetical protein